MEEEVFLMRSLDLDYPGGYLSAVSCREDSRGDVYFIGAGTSSNSSLVYKYLRNHKRIEYVAGEDVEGSSAYEGFDSPLYLLVDREDNVIVADSFHHSIRKVYPDGRITTMAGKCGGRGFCDGSREEARFSCPYGLFLDPQGNLLIADSDNFVVRKLDKKGEVTTIAGVPGLQGCKDGEMALFSEPCGICSDEEGNIFVSDSENHRIRKIDKDGTIVTFAGSISGYRDGDSQQALFHFPIGITYDRTRRRIYVADLNNNVIRSVNREGIVTSLLLYEMTGSELCYQPLLKPESITCGYYGNLLVTEVDGRSIRCLEPLSWIPSRHWVFPAKTRKRIQTLMMVWRRQRSNVTYFQLGMIPRDLVFVIISFAI